MSEQDSFLKCDKCGAEFTTNFGGSLSSGWPTCCGYTMRLERTNADIGDAVAAAAQLTTAAEGGDGAS